MSAAQKGSDALSRGKEIDTITKYLNKFTGISKQAKQELKGLLDQLQSGDPSVNVKKIHERFLELTVAEREAGREGQSWLEIFNTKKLHSFLGQAASMGAFLLSSGKKGKRMALPSARIMIHQPLGGAKGQATDIELEAKEILRMKDMLIGIMAENAGQPFDKVKEDCERDHYLSAAEAVEYGLIDKVVTSTEA